MRPCLLIIAAAVLLAAPFAFARAPAPTPSPTPKFAPIEEAKAAVAALNKAKTEGELLAAISHLKEVYHPTTVKAALQIVTDSKKSVKARAQAASVLGVYRDKSAASKLNTLILNAQIKKEVELATAITWALGEIADPSSIAPLFKLFRFKETEVAVASVRALGKIKDKRVVDSLIKVLDTTEDTEDASNTKQRRYIQVASAARQALISITKESFPAARDYRKWWKEHSADFSFEPKKKQPQPTPER